MRLHLVALPHAHTTLDQTVCAFTANAVKFAEMMHPRHEITIYSGNRNDAPCHEHVALYQDDEQQAWYGHPDQNTLPTRATWNASDKPWRIVNARAVAAIAQRLQEGDLILLLGGIPQRAIADAFPEIVSCEWAAGYVGTFSPHVCYPSHAWRNYLYGRQAAGGRFYDTVIAHPFRANDFHLAQTKTGDLLYIGRMIPEKGVHIAADLALKAGRRLLLAGPGVTNVHPGRIECEQMTLEGDHLEYLGVLGAEERAHRMAEAHAVLIPTTYIEPFGAVAVEAQLSGTPAITTDFGAFTETVEPRYRFTTFQQGLDAIDAAADTSPTALRDRALGLYSQAAIAPQYDAWLERLATLTGDGWYTRADTLQPTKEAA